MKTYTERVTWAMKRIGMSQSDLARTVGVKAQSIQYLCNPKREAQGSKHSARIAAALMVSSIWLETGEGEPFTDTALSQSSTSATSKDHGIYQLLLRRLEIAMHKASMTQIDLARVCKEKLPIVSEWLSGRARLYGDNLLRVAKALGVSSGWLSSGRGLMYSPDDNVSPGPDTLGEVPLISWVQAGEWHEAEDPYHPGDAETYLPCPVKCSPRTYALRVVGDSMTAEHGKSYPEKCVIYVDPELPGGLTTGDRVIAKINGEDAVTFKTYVEDGGRKYLKALNPAYPIITAPFRVLGKVIGKWEDE